jgi:hypothetical protein
MSTNDLIDFPDSDNQVEATHKRYMDAVKKALLIGIGSQPRTEDKFREALDEVLNNRDFWHDPEIYDQVHYIANGQTFDASRIKDPRERSPLPSQFQAAISALPLIEAEMERYYGGATIQEIMGNYYLGTPLSPVEINQSEVSEDSEGDF